MHHKLLINVRYPQNQIYPLDLALGILTMFSFPRDEKNVTHVMHAFEG